MKQLFLAEIFTSTGVTLFSDYQALMRIWTHPWCLKLEALRRPERFDDTDSMEDFVVNTDEETEEEEVESLKTTTSEDESAESKSSSDSDVGLKRSKGRTERRKVRELSSGNKEVIRPSRRTRSYAPNSTVNIDGEAVEVVEVDVKPSVSGAKEKLHSKNNGKGNSSHDTSSRDEYSNFGSTRSGTAFKDNASDVEVQEKEWYDEFLSEEDETNVELSGKLVLLLEILADAHAVGDKVLVFSQSLVTLDLIEKALGGGEVGGDRENWCRGCDYFRMDGSTSVNLRQRWADIFNDKDNDT